MYHLAKEPEATAMEIAITNVESDGTYAVRVNGQHAYGLSAAEAVAAAQAAVRAHESRKQEAAARAVYAPSDPSDTSYPCDVRVAHNPSDTVTLTSDPCVTHPSQDPRNPLSIDQ